MKMANFTGKRFQTVRINHDVATFESESFVPKTSITCIPLGLIRTRTLWPDWSSNPSVKRPICISNDLELGWPDAERYNSETGRKHIQGECVPCASCPLKDWQGRQPPRCTLNWNIPFIIPTNETIFILNITSSNVKPLEKWLEPYRAGKMPLYQMNVAFSLRKFEKGGRRLAALVIEEIKGTVSSRWPSYSKLYREAREELTKDPGWRHVDGSRPISLGGQNPGKQFQNPY